jgi:hypothetical protein
LADFEIFSRILLLRIAVVKDFFGQSGKPFKNTDNIG